MIHATRFSRYVLFDRTRQMFYKGPRYPRWVAEVEKAKLFAEVHHARAAVTMGGARGRDMDCIVVPMSCVLHHAYLEE